MSKNLVGEEVSITDLSGRILMKEKITSSNIQLQALNLSDGIYFVRVKNTVKKFIKD